MDYSVSNPADSNPAVTIRTLKAIPYFADKPVPALLKIADDAEMRFYNQYDVIFNEGDTTGELFIIARGEVNITSSDGRGRIFNLAKLRKGDFFGEQACLRNIPRTATAIASRDCSLVFFKRPKALSMYDQHDFFRQHMNELLQSRQHNRRRVILLKLIEQEFKNTLEAILTFNQECIEKAERQKPELVTKLGQIKLCCNNFIDALEIFLGPQSIDDLTAFKIEATLSIEVKNEFQKLTETITQCLAEIKNDLIDIGIQITHIDILEEAMKSLDEKKNLIIDFYWLQIGRVVVSQRISNLQSQIEELSKVEKTLAFIQEKLDGTIMIIESNNLQRNILNTQLTRFGLKSVAVNSAASAKEQLKFSSVDVFCIDLLNPDQNAIEFIKEMKTLEATKNIPVIILSSLDDTDTAIQCLEIGAKEFLHKPVPNSILFASVKRALAEIASVRREQRFLKELKIEKDRSENLLLNILPKSIAERLKVKPGTIADSIDEATVFFCDLCNFSSMTNGMPATVLVEKLNQLFTYFDDIVNKHGVEKIKTMGDAYMAIAGAPEPQADHALRMMKVAIDFMQAVLNYNTENNAGLNLRLGLHTGKLTAGVVGKQKFVYDIWGDTVNLASRMESTGTKGCIQVSEVTYSMIKDHFEFTGPKTVTAKGFGEVKTYLYVFEPLFKLEASTAKM